ncbi:hypothetical protein D7X48_14805 [bacterium D16-50]|nr:hypothetical protein D7X48_14805 [bacterium D16-50]
MVIRGRTKSIAEYAFRKWMADRNLAEENFVLTVTGREAVLADGNGDSLTLVYDSGLRAVCLKEE